MTQSDNVVPRGRIRRTMPLAGFTARAAAGLNATLPIRAILEDMDGIADPVTELGKLHHAWVRERGLPSALDHHDHP
jgi:hypothetical protein